MIDDRIEKLNVLAADVRRFQDLSFSAVAALHVALNEAKYDKTMASTQSSIKLLESSWWLDQLHSNLTNEIKRLQDEKNADS